MARREPSSPEEKSHKRITLAGLEQDAQEVKDLFAHANSRKANALSMLDAHIAAAQELRRSVASMK